jgi:type IV secretory pathway TraG/TraD family ATPase VirD4
MAGTMTVHRETRTYTGNRLNPILMHVMAAEQETQRPLLTPDEVMRLPDDAALIFVAGQPPIYGRRIRYYEDPIFAARASIRPPAASDRLPHQWSTWAGPAGSARTALAPADTKSMELAVLGPVDSAEEREAVDTLVPLTRSAAGAEPDWPLHELAAVERESHDGGS